MDLSIFGVPGEVTMVRVAPTRARAPLARRPKVATSGGRSARRRVVHGPPVGAGEWLPANTLVLTFDDGPDDQTLPIARFLFAEGIRATFFVNGKRFCRISGGACTSLPVTGGCAPRGDQWKNTKVYDESLIDLLQRYGHRVANHTHDHCHLAFAPDEMAWELRTTQEILDRHGSDGLSLFRPPYGSWGTNNDAEVRGDSGLRRLIGPVLWDIDGRDWLCWRTGVSVAQCLQHYIDAVDARPGRNGIVLMHDRPEFNVDDPSYYSGTDNTLELTRRFVQAMRGRGYRFAGIEEAVRTGPLS